MTEQSIKVGIFDSGLGGLSVVRELRKQLPAQPMIYLGDQIHTPYGVRSLEEVRQLTTKAVEFLFGQGAQLIVIACNTASVASLKSLRAQFPETPFVGMEPAVKPAAEQTHSKVVGVLATYATFQSELYASVVERFARDVKVLQSSCPGLVAEIEKGNLRGDETRKILHTALDPMIAEGIDTVVMGCTHYPFVIPLVKEIVGPDVAVIDPAPAIARRTEFLLKEHGWQNEEGGRADIIFYTSGNPRSMSDLLPELIGESGEVRQAVWQDGCLH